ncbi:hypothetical protein C6502_17080 [Candidatus Poribacteria bacterium]|nr:MAG: hypothetical protein C6502_17080 [Candidatus Poribacteria bacterium]
MKTHALCFTVILLSNFALSIFTPDSIAQTQDYSTVNLPDGAIARLGKGGVSYRDRGIAFSPDGSRLAVATSMGVWLYDTETFDELALLTGHKEEVTVVAFSPDGTKLASGSGFHFPGTLKLWEVKTGQNINTFQVKRGSTDSISFSPDGKILAWADRLWAVDTGQQLDIPLDNKLFEIVFSPDGKILAGTGISTVERTHVGVIKFYEVETGRLINTLTATQRTKWSESSKRISSIAFSPDGRLLASGSADDGTIKLWDVETGQNIATFTEKPEPNSSMLCVAFSPEGTKLVVGSAAGIKLLEVPTGEYIYARQHIDIGELEFSLNIFSVAFSPDGTKLASASWDGVKLWEVETGQNIATLQGHTRVVSSVAFSPDGLTFASDSVGGVQVWEAATGRHITTFAGPPNFVTAIAYSPDGTRIATGSANARNAEHTVKLWDVETEHNTITLHGHTDAVTTIAYSRDGTLLASGSKDKTVKLWDVSTGENIATLHGHEKRIFSIAFSPDGTKLASGSEDTSIRLWEIPTGRVIHILGGVNSPQVGVTVLPARRPGQDINELQAVDGVDPEPEIIRGLVFSVAFSPDGIKLAAVVLDDGETTLWDVGTGQHITTLTSEHSSAWVVAFSPDGTKLAVGTGTGNNTVELWDVSTYKPVAAFSGHTGSVYAVAFSPDGTKVASGSSDGTVLLWDVPKSIKLYPNIQRSNR